MKQTKNAENKKAGNKITFRVNVVEDKKIIEYIDKATNGSAFIKEALKFYIIAIERGMVNSYYLEDIEREWRDILEVMDVEPKKATSFNKDKGTEELIIGINEIEIDYDTYDEYRGI